MNETRTQLLQLRLAEEEAGLVVLRWPSAPGPRN